MDDDTPFVLFFSFQINTIPGVGGEGINMSSEASGSGRKRDFAADQWRVDSPVEEIFSSLSR